MHKADPSGTRRTLSFPLDAGPVIAPAFRRAEHRGTGPVGFAELLAATAALLARYNEAQNVVVGCIEAGHGTATVRELRIELREDPSFGDALAAVRACLAAPAQAPAHVPRVLVAALGEPNIGDVALTSDHLRLVRRAFARCEVSALGDRAGDLTLGYDADLFSATAVRRLAERIDRLATLGRGRPDAPISDFELTGPEERAALLALAAAKPSDGRARLEELIEEQARRHPEHIAVSCAGTDVTYGRLSRWSEAVASRLRALRVGPGARVGIRLPRSPELLAALIGVLKAGAAYVPLDPAQPRGRQRQIAETAGLAVLLVPVGDDAELDGVPNEPVPAEPVSNEPGPNKPVSNKPVSNEPVPAEPVSNEPVPAEPVSNEPGPAESANRVGPRSEADRAVGSGDHDAPAYVLFTSGSTGRPKGVEVRHSNVVRLFDTTRDLFETFTDRDVWVNAHSIAFDASVWEIFGALLHGGRLVLPGQGAVRDPDAMTELVERERVTMLTLSPTAFEGFRESTLAAGRRYPALRHLVLCAEALSLPSLARWFDFLGDQQPRVVNMYGITETTVHTTFCRLTAADVRDPRRRIGHGLPDTPVYLLDEHGRLVPFGMPGEICVGGPGVSAGYLRSPENDRDPFAADPFAAVPGARMYRSGDKGRRLADGSLEYLGRFDHQVKIRGYRIELGEVEAAFLALPEVRGARAWVSRREGHPPALAVAVVLTSHGRAAPPELRSHVAERLPGYMVPAGVVVVEEFPSTVNGKLDTARLPDPFADGAPPADVADVAEAPLVGRVRVAVAQVLGRPSVGPDAGFFELGGDSITAVRLVARLRAQGLDATLAEVYARRTSRGIAEALAVLGPGGQRALEPFALLAAEDRVLVPDTAENALPATRLQQGMLLHGLLDGEHVYHDVLSYTVDTALDEPALRRALHTVVQRHPVLRTAFLAAGPRTPLQIVHRQADVGLHVIDLRGVPGERRAHAVEEWAAAERSRPFDWGVPGLLRVFVHRTGDAESVLSLSVHHCVLDGWSAATLVTELLSAHLAEVGGHAGPVARVDSLMDRYVALERAAERDAAHRGYWREYLRDAEPTRLPGSPESTGASPDSTVGTVTVPIPSDAAHRFRDLARLAGVPLKTAYLAVHTALLAFVSGRPEVVTGVVTSGRIEEEGGDRALGLFLNTVPLRLRGADHTWRELLAEVFLNESRGYPYRRLPYERIQAESGIGRLCPTAFNYTDFHVYDALAALGVRLRDIRYREATDFQLLLTVNEDPFGDSACVTIGYQHAALTAQRAAMFAKLFVRLVEQAVEDPDGPAVRRLAEWAVRAGLSARVPDGAPAGVPTPVLRRVAAQVSRLPSAVAQVHRGREMTFAQLAERVGALRGRLLERGAGPGTRVACFLERGHDPLVALLGVWAAGGVYVPIDPRLPPARQRTMLRAAGCRLALRSAGVRAERPAWEGEILVLGASDTAADAGCAAWHLAEPDEEAYVLLTSGSTGEPKAVVMPHRSIGNLIGWQLAQPEFAAPRRIGQFAGLSFDVSVQELLTAAAGGGTLVVVPEQARRDPQALQELLAREWVEVLFAPPMVLRQLAVLRGELGAAPNGLRCVVTAGEALVVTDAVREFCAAGRIALVNQYGPTETHVTTSHRLTGEPSRWPERPPIGRPIDGVTVRVLDPLGRPVPEGTPGELWLGGLAPALGYVAGGEPDPRTVERFVDLADGTGVHYRTGDVVGVADGELSFLGRSDGQLKIRGFRIEPEEVAAVLSRHPGVRGCAVAGEPTHAGDLALVAYAEPVPRTSGVALTTERLLGHARAELPEYAVPSRIVLLERLPLTHSGKLDRARLPRTPAEPGKEQGSTPLTATERAVLAAWQQVLGHPVRSPTISFFDAGGTSLLLLPLYLRLRKDFDQEFALHDLFRFPTVCRFAQFLDGARGPDQAANTRRRRAIQTSAHILAVAQRGRSARRRENTTDD